MRLDKKQCREYVAPGWKVNLNNGLLYVETINYLVKTAVRLIAHQRVLVLYIYSRKSVLNGDFRPLWTMFQNKEEYLTLARKEDGSLHWRTSMFDNLEREYWFQEKCAFVTAKDESRVIRFLQSDNPKGFSALYAYQSNLLDKRRRERQHKRELEIKKKMESVPTLPRGLKQYIHKEIMPAYIFYNYHKGKKEMEGFCTCCNEIVPISGVKHNMTGTCPHCKRAVTYKSRGKRGYIVDRNTLQVFSRISDKEIVVRFVKIYYSYRKEDVSEKSIYENARIFVSWPEGKCLEERYYYSYRVGSLTPWTKGDRPVFSRWQYNFEADNCGFLYYENLDGVLQGTPWQYSQLKSYYLADPTPLYVLQYLYQYSRYPMLEYMVKLGLYRLTTDAVYGNGVFYGDDAPINPKGKNIREVLGVDKSILPLLRKINPGSAQLKLIRNLLRQKIVLDEELLAWCSQYQVSRIENLTVPLQYMTPYKFMQYAGSQFKKFERKSWASQGGYWKMEDLLSDYRDYLAMSEALEYDLRNSFVLFPERLKEAHDKVNDLSDKKQMQIYNRQIEKMAAALERQYSFSKWGFVIIPPHSAKEIVEEGHKLHHCVGGYVGKIVKRECIILFVRKKDEIDKPLCTLEIRGEELLQARIKNNDSPTAKIQKFLDAWEQQVLKAPAFPAAA